MKDIFSFFTALSTENATLHSCTLGNCLIRIQSHVRLLSIEVIPEKLLNLGNPSASTTRTISSIWCFWSPVSSMAFFTGPIVFMNRSLFSFSNLVLVGGSERCSCQTLMLLLICWQHSRNNLQATSMLNLKYFSFMHKPFMQLIQQLPHYGSNNFTKKITDFLCYSTHYEIHIFPSNYFWIIYLYNWNSATNIQAFL